MIRSSKYCKRYEYVRFDLQTPIIYPANAQFQEKSGYKFYVDTTSDVSPMDIYNAYIEMDLKMTKKADNTGYADNDQVAIINGNCSLINKLECDFSGATVINTPSVNHAIDLKNMAEFSREYSDKVGLSMFWYPNTSVNANSKKYTIDNGNHDHVKGDNDDYNHGFAQRRSPLLGLKEVNTIYPLNRFGFIEAFEDKILPNGKMIFTITLESDNNVIFRTGGAEGRFIVTKMVLWIPKMMLNVAGERILLDKYLTNRSWTYLKEKIEVSPVLQVREGVFRITSAIQNPKHLFVWFLNTNKINNQLTNMFNYDTYDITSDSRKVVDCQVEVNSGNYYPQVRLNPNSELMRAYRMLIDYTKAFNDHYGAPLIDSNDFRKLFGILYFDLSGQEDNMRDENVKLEFRFTLNDNPGGAVPTYNIYALVLHEQTVSLDVTSGKALLRV